MYYIVSVEKQLQYICYKEEKKHCLPTVVLLGDGNSPKQKTKYYKYKLSFCWAMYNTSSCNYVLNCVLFKLGC